MVRGGERPLRFKCLVGGPHALKARFLRRNKGLNVHGSERPPPQMAGSNAQGTRANSKHPGTTSVWARAIGSGTRWAGGRPATPEHVSPTRPSRRAMFKNLHTRTKLLILCGLFIVSLGVATHQLFMEKQLAIDFARKELVGNRYVSALAQIYAPLMIDAQSNGSTEQPNSSGDRILSTLTIVETDAGKVLHTAEFETALAASLADLWSNKAGRDRDEMISDALAKARNLATRIGDDFEPHSRSGSGHLLPAGSRRATELPALLGELAELQILVQTGRRCGLTLGRARRAHSGSRWPASFHLGGDAKIPHDRLLRKRGREPGNGPSISHSPRCFQRLLRTLTVCGQARSTATQRESSSVRWTARMRMPLGARSTHGRWHNPSSTAFSSKG